MPEVDNLRHIELGIQFGIVVVLAQLQLARANQPAVLAGESDRLAAGPIDVGDDFLVHKTGQHHFDDIHGFAVGHPHAGNEFGLFADLLQHRTDLRAAAVDDDRIDADLLEQRDVGGETRLEFLLDHGVAAIFYHHGLIGEALQVRQRLDQCGGPRGGVFHAVLPFFVTGSVSRSACQTPVSAQTASAMPKPAITP